MRIPDNFWIVYPATADSELADCIHLGGLRSVELIALGSETAPEPWGAIAAYTTHEEAEIHARALWAVARLDAAGMDVDPELRNMAVKGYLSRDGVAALEALLTETTP